ncbi:hypothetical protein H0O03_03015 [Candidatus Micrarchaeota archaeon]|nr:hypothetical protein [Candidatus Micrarchaeota archaeon]
MMKKALFALAFIALFSLAAAADSCKVLSKTGNAGSATTFVISYEMAAVTQYEVTWGDGSKTTSSSTNEVNMQCSTKTCQVPHTYASTGSYAVSASLWNANNAKVTCDTATATISTASNPTPTATPTPTPAAQTVTNTGITNAWGTMVATTFFPANSLIVATARPVAFGSSALQALAVTNQACLVHLWQTGYANVIDVATAADPKLSPGARNACIAAGLTADPVSLQMPFGEDEVTGNLYETSWQLSPEALKARYKPDFGVSQECFNHCASNAVKVVPVKIVFDDYGIHFVAQPECLAACEAAGIKIKITGVTTMQTLSPALQTLRNAFTIQLQLQEVTSNGQTIVLLPATPQFISLMPGTGLSLKPVLGEVYINGIRIGGTNIDITAYTYTLSAQTADGTADDFTIGFQNKEMLFIRQKTTSGQEFTAYTKYEVYVSPETGKIALTSANGYTAVLVTADAIDLEISSAMDMVTSINYEATADGLKITAAGKKLQSFIGLVDTYIDVKIVRVFDATGKLITTGSNNEKSLLSVFTQDKTLAAGQTKTLTAYNTETQATIVTVTATASPSLGALNRV